MADDSTPAVLDEISIYGLLGFGVDGFAPCPPCESPLSVAYNAWPQPDVSCEFPLTFMIDSTAVFIYDANGVYQEFTNQTVTLSLDEADTLRVEGLPLYPIRPRSLSQRSRPSQYVGAVLCDRALTFRHTLERGGGVWYRSGTLTVGSRSDGVKEVQTRQRKRVAR